MTEEIKNNTVQTEALPISELADQLNPTNEIERAVSQLRHGISKPGNDSISRQVRAAMLLLLIASTEQSTDVKRLAELSGLAEEFVSTVADGMRAAGLDGIDNRRWLDDTGWLRGTVLIEEALTCLGEMTRAAQWREMNKRIG